MPRDYCTIPGCNYHQRQRIRKKEDPNCKKDTLFCVRRPDLAKTPTQKMHRQNLTNILLFLEQPSKIEALQFALHREIATICQRHFLKEDLEFHSSRPSLRMGAIPVFHMPKLTDQMKKRLMKHEFKKESEKIFHKSTKVQTADDSNIPLALSNHFNEQSESVNWITLPRNGYSTSAAVMPGLTVSLQEKMWRLINAMNNFCLSIFESCREENFIRKFIDDFDCLKIEFDSVKEMYEISPTVHINSNINEDKHDLAQDDAATPMVTDTNLLNSQFETKENIPAPQASRSNGDIQSNCLAPKIPQSYTSTDIVMGQSREVVNISEIKTNPNRAPSIQKITPILKYNLNRKLNTLVQRKMMMSRATVNKMTSPSAVMKSSVIPLIQKPQLNSLSNVEDEATTNGREPGEIGYKCRRCARICKNLTHLRRHEVQYHKLNHKICSICEKGFCNISAHALLQARERKFVCDVCGAKFFQYGHLRHHTDQITACTFPSFQCKICEEKFHKEEEYGNHFKEKHLKKNIICDLCVDEVCEKCVEDKHQVTLLKLYKCKFCEESFTFKQEYKKHIKEKHVLEISKIWLKCSDCSKYYPYHDALLCHKAKCHAKYRVLCEYCSQTFSNKLSLQRHIRKRHK